MCVTGSVIGTFPVYDHGLELGPDHSFVRQDDLVCEPDQHLWSAIETRSDHNDGGQNAHNATMSYSKRVYDREYYEHIPCHGHGVKLGPDHSKGKTV